MTDLPAAIAAARDALAKYEARDARHYIDEALRDLLAAIDAARGEAVLLVNAEQLADHRVSGMNAVRAGHQDHARGLHTVPLYVAPQAPPATVPAVRITPRDGKWVYGDNDEVFNSCDHETELSAVTDALDNYADAETIYVGQVKTLNVRRMIRADYLLENIGERAYDDVGEAAEHWPELSKDQQAEFEGIIADYILSKSPADFYSVENVRVYTREQAEAMLAAANKENNT